MNDRASDQELAVGAELGHYRIMEKIGAGGMGEVYRARDEHLVRDVAIKILAPNHPIDESARKHFRKEALILSQVNHPNIATIHDFDNHDGTDFLVMEYVRGITLDEKIGTVPLPTREVIQIGLQLAEGLAAAHEQGVVHRDLKPGNLRLTSDGQLKILDFGLAHLRLSLANGATADSLSESFSFAGTLPYMSPEQLLGEEVDARSDIHSTGCVLYEMATGKRPFADAEKGHVIGAILQHSPRPPGALNSNVPPELERIICKCLEKEPGNRYQTAKELAIDLRRLQRDSERGSSELSVGFEVPERRSSSRRLKILAAAISLVVAGVALLLWYKLQQNKPAPTITPSIAVLPFADLSPGHDQEYFSDGLAEQILNDLTKIPNLKVVARTSAFQFKGKNEDLREVGQKLNVDNVLEGSVRREGTRLRVTAQLTNVRDGFQIWSESYDRQLNDILSVQDDIAQAVTSALQLKLLTGGASRSSMSRSSNPEAYRNFLQAQHFRGMSGRDSDMAAGEYIDKAIATDPNYAAAYAFRADVTLFQGTMGWIDYNAAIERARADVEKAIELDPNLAQAYYVLSEIQSVVEVDCKAAEMTARKARELAPGVADNLSQSGFVAMCLGRQEEAVQYLKQALDLDPLLPRNYLLLAQNLRSLGRYQEAEAALQKAVELNPNTVWVHETLGELYLAQGRLQAARAEMEKEPASPLRELGIALVFHDLGDQDKSEAALQILQSRYPGVAAYQVAEVYAYKGQADPAFAWLDRARKQHDGGLLLTKTDPLLQNLHSDPRYDQLLTTLNLAN